MSGAKSPVILLALPRASSFLVVPFLGELVRLLLASVACGKHHVFVKAMFKLLFVCMYGTGPFVWRRRSPRRRPEHHQDFRQQSTQAAEPC
jgi:hypothetical protein